MHRLINLFLLIISIQTFGQSVEYPYLKPKPGMSKSLFDIGFFEKDSFLLKNIVELPNIDIYKLPLYKKRNDNKDKFRLVSYQQISDSFDTYILFDDYYGEAGCYMLYTIDTLGYLINSFEFDGGDGGEFGGYYTNSKFINETLILNSYSTYEREKDSLNNYLDTWKIETTETKYSISKTGEIYVEAEEFSSKKNQKKFY